MTDETHPETNNQPESAPARPYSEDELWIIQNADWPRVLAYYVNGNTTPEDRANLAACMNQISSRTDGDIQSARSLLEREHLVQDASQILDAPDIEVGESTISDAATNWLYYTQKALRFLGDSDRLAGLRSMWREIYNPENAFGMLNTLANELGMFEGSGRRLPVQLIDAVSRAISDQTERFDEHDRKLLQAESVQDTAPVCSGADLLRRTTIIQDSDAWLKDHLQQLPAGFWRGLREIEFVPSLGHEGDQFGGYVYNDNKVRVSVRLPEFEQNHSGSDEVDLAPQAVRDREYLTRAVSGALDHELAHFALARGMTLAQIRELLSVMDDEKVEVTPYAADPEEDIPESVRIYMTNPADLLLRAPKRFAQYNALIGRYSAAILEKAAQIQAEPELDVLALRSLFASI